MKKFVLCASIVLCCLPPTPFAAAVSANPPSCARGFHTSGATPQAPPGDAFLGCVHGALAHPPATTPGIALAPHPT